MSPSSWHINLNGILLGALNIRHQSNFLPFSVTWSLHLVSSTSCYALLYSASFSGHPHSGIYRQPSPGETINWGSVIQCPIECADPTEIWADPKSPDLVLELSPHLVYPGLILDRACPRLSFPWDNSSLFATMFGLYSRGANWPSTFALGFGSYSGPSKQTRMPSFIPNCYNFTFWLCRSGGYSLCFMLYDWPSAPG